VATEPGQAIGAGAGGGPAPPAWLGEAGRFLGTLLLTFLGLIAVTFVIGRVVPVDPVLAVVGDRALPETYAKVRAEMGLDLPLWQQFIDYLGRVLRGDLGTSVITSHPVLEDLLHFFPATLELATMATILGVLAGVPMGIAAATHQGRWPDQLVRVVGLVGYSVPIFWLGLVGLLVLYARLGLVGGPGRIDVSYADFIEPVTGLITVDTLLAGDMDAFRDALSHLALPAGLLGYYSLAYIARMTRSFMLDQLRSEYVVTARAKGLSEARIVWRHALGNILVPLITVIALSYAGLLEGAVLTETVFAWPGLGLYITKSLFNVDMNAVLGGTLMVGAVYIGINLFCDLLYRLVDPRAR
jgi:peptide/nickel transport system permease protein